MQLKLRPKQASIASVRPPSIIIIDERVTFLSTYGVQDHADEAGVSLKSAIAYMIVCDLASFFLDLPYHGASRECPMDFTEDHSDMAKGLKKRCFCKSCNAKLKRRKALYQAVSNMLQWDG